jgi:hypothetical protein
MPIVRSLRPGSLRSIQALALAGVLLAGCSRAGDIDISDGIGITAIRTGCPVVALAEGTGDVTLFDPPASDDAAAIDVTATITNLRATCNAEGARIYSGATFDVIARRTRSDAARTVVLPYYSAVVQGGSAVVAKQTGEVRLDFAAGAATARASGRAGAYIDAAAARLPDDIRNRITRRRKAGDEDAAVDPLSEPDVRAALTRATFEQLVGFQLTEAQLRYNATR